MACRQLRSTHLISEESDVVIIYSLPRYFLTALYRCHRHPWLLISSRLNVKHVWLTRCTFMRGRWGALSQKIVSAYGIDEHDVHPTVCWVCGRDCRRPFDVRECYLLTHWPPRSRRVMARWWEKMIVPTERHHLVVVVGHWQKSKYRRIRLVTTKLSSSIEEISS